MSTVKITSFTGFSFTFVFDTTFIEYTGKLTAFIVPCVYTAPSKHKARGDQYHWRMRPVHYRFLVVTIRVRSLISQYHQYSIHQFKSVRSQSAMRNRFTISLVDVNASSDCYQCWGNKRLMANFFGRYARNERDYAIERFQTSSSVGYITTEI